MKKPYFARNMLLWFLAILAVSGAAHAASTTIWGSTSRSPAVITMRLPVDIGSSSGPGYLTVGNLNTYVQANAPGSNRNILFNSGGAVGFSANFLWNNATNTLTTSHLTVEGVTSTGAQGTGNIMFSSASTCTNCSMVNANLGTPSVLSLANAAGLLLAGGGTGLTAVPGSSSNLIYNNGGAYGAESLSSALDVIGSTTGQIIYRSAGGWLALGPGTDGYVLTTHSTGNAPTWTASASDPTTTKGDVSTYSTVAARLGVGTDGQLLSADSSQTTGLKWITASGTGTVTSVSGSGGTTGLTLTGGAITSTGTLTLGGTLVIADGGTGVTSLPGSSGNVLYNSGGALGAVGTSGSGNVLFSSASTCTNCSQVNPALGTIASGDGSALTGTAPSFKSGDTSAINGATLGTATATAGNLLIGQGTTWATKGITGGISFTSAGLSTVLTNANLSGVITSSGNTTSFDTGAHALPAAWTGGAGLTAGTATNAVNVASTQVSNSATYYPILFSSSTNGNQAADLGTGLGFNPSTNTLTTTHFAGALTGNADTVTTDANLSGVITSSGNTTSFDTGANAIPTAWTAVTQTAGTNNTTVSTTAYTNDAVNNTPINSQSGDYTLVIGDNGKFIDMTKGTTATLTIPANASVAFPVGAQVTIRQAGAGQITIAITSDTLNNPAATLKLRAQYSQVTITKISSTVWTIIGDLAAS